MAPQVLRTTALAIGLATIALSGCGRYVMRDEFDAAIAELRAADQRLQEQITSLSQKHDALVTQMAGRIRIETSSYFDTGVSTLREQDKPLLDDFAKAIRSSNTDAIVTVEGFADPAGPAAFNKRLGQSRAEAVRDYLVTNGGLLPAQVRAVSYGEATDRLIIPGGTGNNGRENRRVSLVIDYAGLADANARL